MKYNKNRQKLYLDPKFCRIFDLNIVYVQAEEHIILPFLSLFSKYFIRDGSPVEMAISPCLTLLPTSFPSKDRQNSVYSLDHLSFQVYWFKDGKQISKRNGHCKMRREEDGTCSLHIESTTSDDDGNYTIMAANPQVETQGSALCCTRRKEQ